MESRTSDRRRGARQPGRAGCRVMVGPLALAASLLASAAGAAPFTVNSTGDEPDLVLNGTCLTGVGTCTLRAALMEANNTAGPHTIFFSIAGGGPHTIQPASALPALNQAIAIAGYTQPGSSPNSLAVGNNAILRIELDGSLIVPEANGLTINFPGCQVRGLAINRFTGYGIQVTAAGVVIQGNFVGTNVAGTAALGNNRGGVGSEGGIGIFANGATIGGTAPQERNLVSGNNVNCGRGIELWDAGGATIRGNYVGTNAAGTAAIPNGCGGIVLDGAPAAGSDANTVGGSAAGAGNLLSGNDFEGIFVQLGSDNNTIQGNLIGTNGAGSAGVANGAQGIKIQSSGNKVGGAGAGEGNTIAFNSSDGVRIVGAGVTGNAIVGNVIRGNTGLGINLGTDAVTNNDPGDGDGGPNGQLNFPVIDAVSVLGSSLVVSFSLDVPAGSYRVEFFKNPTGVDPSGNGEGEAFAAFQNVTHGGGGSRSFSAAFAGVSGDRITATTTLCTDGGVCAAFSDTSEFSAWLIATPTNYRSIGGAPPYSVGSLNATSGSQAVAGVGTAWATQNRGRGDVISICDQASPTCTTSTDYTVLGVGSDTQLTLTTAYAGSTGSHDYTIRRQFTTLTAWEDCVDGPGGVACLYFPVASTNLITENRSEVGIAYDDTPGADFPGGLTIDGASTDATHTITLTADGGNRHYGLPGQGVLVDNGASITQAIQVLDDFVTVEWMEITGGGGTATGILVNLLSPGGASLVTLRNNLIHNVPGDGIGLYDDDGRVYVYNNISHNNLGGLWINPPSLLPPSRIWIFNNTFYGNQGGVWKAAGASAARVLLANNISVFNNPSADYNCDPLDSVQAASGNNLDEDGSGGTGAGTHNPAGGRVTSTVAAVAFVNAGAGDLHIGPGSSARDAGLDMGALFTTDVDAALRSAPWDIGADETGATPLYRSVGITAAALATGAANALTISGSTATFASGLPSPIGVGDVIQYDSDGNSSIDALAFIHGRTSSQSYTVKDKNGATPTAVIGDNNWGIYRAYTSLANWESQTENPNILEPVENDVNPSLNLVAANTVMNVACYGDGADTTPVTVSGWTTGANNYIRIYTPYLGSEVGTSQRHSGTWNTTTAYRLQAAVPAPNEGVLWLRTNYVRVDGLQVWFTNDMNYAAGIYMNGAAGVSSYDVSNNIVRGIGGSPSQPGRLAINTFNAGTAGSVANIWNNLVYDFNGLQLDVGGIAPDDPDVTFYVYNNTVVDSGQGIVQYDGTVVARNNLCYNNSNNYVFVTGFAAASTHNLSGPGADADIPAANARNGVTVTFVNAAADNFHLSGSDTGALNWGANLSADASLAILLDIDHQVRVPAWDIGADDASGTTAVKLLSFEARPLDSAVALAWQTGSELDNLGFHVYRGASADGPWSRITASMIPGLGSSAVGRAYSLRDTGLTNGVRYFYRLDDVDASSKTTSHGPVSAVPLAGATEEAPEGDGPGARAGRKPSASSTCPAWVLAAHGSAGGAGSAPPRCTRHGDPEAVSLAVLSRDARSATLELRTGGFYALHTAPSDGEPSGTVRVFVPGFEFPQDAEAAALPVRRALVDAVVGRRAKLGGVRALDLVAFKGLAPAGLGQAEMQLGEDGTVRAARRSRVRPPRRFPKSELATLLPSLFQGERKSAVVELAPLRFEAERQRLVLAKRVLVRLLFTGREAGERGRGSLGRAPRRGTPASGEVLARLFTTSAGLHAVSFEQLFPGRARGFRASQLRLERQGEPVSVHLEPAAEAFGPGSRLYFHAERTASSTDFTAEVAYELVRGPGGAAMPILPAAPRAGAVATAPSVARSFEVNRFYQPGLLAAEDPWQWEAVASGATRVMSFSLARVSPSGGGELDVFLQGASESGQAVDHHVSVSVNGTLVGEAQFAGKLPYRVSLGLPPSLLREGTNELSLTSVADTGVASLVFLDRFQVAHAGLPSLTDGRFEGTWAESGTASIAGLTGSAALVDVQAPGGAQWLSGYPVSGGSLSFHAEAGHRYLAVTPEALAAPRVESPATSTLRAATNQADYLLIAPRAFLPAAEPLLSRRQDQGLRARAVAFEEIADEFGHGRPSAEAIRDFLAHAYQSWARPSPRYALLLGDASYDPRSFSGVAQPSPLPALWTKTSYLWTASDPLLAAVNGGDALPDLAIGRLPAQTAEQAQALVEKLLAWEDSGQGLAGPATLVADNPDAAGDFEANAREVAAAFLAGRSELLLLRQLGAETRPRIQAALDAGLGYLDYVGHGGSAVWASENVWNSWDAASLQAQSRQPLLLTMNCLNGYFVAPSFDSLAESLVKAEGRGAIAAFSPSGLSLDGPAHQYHRALLAELTSDRHERLGDAILAAQQAYVQGGLMPELVAIYQLLGDPAMAIR